MQIHNDPDQLPALSRPAITLGTFDGVHRGHRLILERLRAAAGRIGGESVLLTFWPHPRMVLQPDDPSLKLLNTIEEKTRLLADSGIDHLVIMPFTREFSRTSYLDFIRNVLVGKLGMKYMVVGHDHHFGKNREGTFEQLQECAPIFNFGLEQVEALKVDGVNISSSKIRAALAAGELDKANTYLGYPYFLSGTVVRGEGRGKDLGFPTANIVPEEKFKLVPADGIYAVEVQVGPELHKGMMSIGYNPTFSGSDKTLEVNILDFEGDLYGQKIEVKFWNFLRKEAKFANAAELIRQINADKRQTLQFFDKHQKNKRFD